MPADLAIVGARIRTLDPARPFATAVAVRHGTIVAVGGEAEVRAHCDARTEVLHAGGQALIPGLTDSHLHPFWGAELARGVDLSHCKTSEEVLAALAAGTVNRGWLFAWGLDYDAAPSIPDIAAAVDGAAAFVRLSDLHTGLATPRALELAQVDGPRAFPDHSEVVCDEHGTPTGELREMSAQDLVLRAAPKLRWPELRARYVAELQRLNALGLTGAHVMDGEPATYDLLRDLEGTDELTMRLRVPLWMTPETTDEEMEAQLPLRDLRGRLWRGGVVKFFADGVIDSGTAWLEEPDTHGEGLKPYWPEPERLAKRDRAVRARRLPGRDAHDRRRRRALRPERLHRGRRGARHPPPARAPRGAPRRSGPGDPRRGRGRVDAARAHGRRQAGRQLERAARARAGRARVPDARPARRRRRARARQRLAGRGRRPAARARDRAAAAAAVAGARRSSRTRR